MTGSQVKGKSFRGALSYNLEKVAAGKGEVIDNSFVNASERGIMKEVAMVRIQRPDLKKYFYHTSINFPKDENLSNELLVKIGHDYLEANGFNQHQYIMFRHYDADHPHFHILVNRIGYDGTVVTDSNDYARSEKVLRDLEKKYNLMQVTSSKQAQNRGLTKNEIEMVRRSKMPSHKLAMQIIIRNVLETKKEMTTDEFISALSAKGVSVIFNQASTGYVSGISYAYQGMVMQGSKLGNAFKWSTIKNTINYEQERDRQRIYACPSVALRRRETNARSKSTIDQLGTGNEHAPGNRVNPQQGNVQYRSIQNSISDVGKFIFRSSFQIARLVQVDRELGRAVDPDSYRDINTVLKIPAVLPLATLLGIGSRGNHFGAVNQPAMGDSMKQVPKMKKKKKRLRI